MKFLGIMGCRHRDFWLIAISYGFMTGVYSGWGSFLAPNIVALHFVRQFYNYM